MHLEAITFYPKKAVQYMSMLLRHACRYELSWGPGHRAGLIISGCSGDSDKVVVDFTKTVPVARPGERASPTPPLRVAVAAMISPKETFDLYRQLLGLPCTQAG